MKNEDLTILNNSMKNYKRVLTIAGSDSGGGAGIQADIKTISALGCIATSAITAVTAQNTMGVTDIHPIPTESVKLQIEAVLSDIGTNSVKIGMLHNAETIRCVYESLQEYNILSSVLDPVLISTSGKPLLEKEAIDTLTQLLIPAVRVITPNIPEAKLLLGKKINSLEDLPNMARDLSEKYNNVSVLLKAGHATGNILIDIFYNAETQNTIPLTSQRINSINTHGTGCTLSSAFAAFLALGEELDNAAIKAKDYINKAIQRGAEYKIGKGHGPVMHFHKHWR